MHSPACLVEPDGKFRFARARSWLERVPRGAAVIASTRGAAVIASNDTLGIRSNGHPLERTTGLIRWTSPPARWGVGSELVRAELLEGNT